MNKPSLDHLLLFEEDFSSIPVSVIGGDYSPAGEYHVPPELARAGPWRETVIHHSFARISRGNWQVVLEDGHHVLEQTIAVETPDPILAASVGSWSEASVSAGIRPLTKAGRRALLFRYRHARRWYGAVFSADMVRIIRRDNNLDTLLGEASCVLNPDQFHHVQITCEEGQITLSVGGQELLRCEDPSPNAFLSGSVAFAASHPTRFRHLRVTAPRPGSEAAAALRQQQETALRALQASSPQPRVWRKIPTPHWGTDRNLRAGDLDGDGRPEIVLARRTDRLGGDNFASITSLAAYNLEGELLWTIGDPGQSRHPVTCDLCFQVHDIDGDGKAEVLFCQDWRLHIVDGATGSIRRSMPLPLSPEGDPGPLYRVLGDSLFFCDLTGSGRPDSIILKDRYRNAWAYDRDLRLLWSFAGNLGHYPFARDIDGDGKDELALGYHLLDHNGACLWSVQYEEHADNVAMVDLPASELSGQPGPRVVIAGSDAGFFILDLQGQQQAHYPIGHAQSLCIANLLPEREGLEIMVNTFWGAAGITAVLDESGRLLHEFVPMPYACLLQPVNWVPLNHGPAPADLVLLSTHPQDGGLIDGRGRRIVMFPDDGHPTLCSDSRDLDGDGIDEVLTWDDQAIWIYKTDVSGRSPATYPRRNPWYNDSNYRAQVSLPP